MSLNQGIAELPQKTIHPPKKMWPTSHKALIDENSKLKDEVCFDHLTGIYNRRYLDHQLSLMSTSGDIHGATIFMLDIDNFKNFNEMGGHANGDKKLQEVASALTGLFHATDLVARYGGDEFTIVLANITDPDIVQNIAFRLKEAMEEKNIYISFGFASANKSDEEQIDFHKILDKADIELKRMKEYKHL